MFNMPFEALIKLGRSWINKEVERYRFTNLENKMNVAVCDTRQYILTQDKLRTVFMEERDCTAINARMIKAHHTKPRGYFDSSKV